METQATQTDLFDKDPLVAGTDGQGANPAADPRGANRVGSKFGSYFADRAKGAAIAERRRKQMTEGLTLTEATGFAIMVLRKLSAADGGRARRAAEGRRTGASDAGAGGDAGNGLKG